VLASSGATREELRQVALVSLKAFDEQPGVRRQASKETVSPVAHLS
jgi:hypothetical protein